MTTVRELVFDALSDLRVTALGEEPTAEEAGYCLTRFNQMMHDFELDGMALAHLDQALDDDIDVPDHHITALRLSLMERVAGRFGAQVTPQDNMRAEQARMALRAYHFSIAGLECDHPLATPGQSTD